MVLLGGPLGLSYAPTSIIQDAQLTQVLFSMIDLQIILQSQSSIIVKLQYTASLLSSSHLSLAFTRHLSLSLMLSPMLLDTDRLD